MTKTMDVYGKEFRAARIKDLEERVSQKRLKHILGVEQTAAKLASVYGEDVQKAALAGLLHDWDKGMNDEEIRTRALELDIDDGADGWVIKHMPATLHGPTAAAALSRTFPDIPHEVIRAIEIHTIGAPQMTALDKILYIADALEPGRNFAEITYLRDLTGASSLNELFFEVYKFWTCALISHGRVLHPQTVEVWNSLVSENAKS
jgi:predicted HD superfamily hydrolase involved in NAD metabolism